MSCQLSFERFMKGRGLVRSETEHCRTLRFRNSRERSKTFCMNSSKQWFGRQVFEFGLLSDTTGKHLLDLGLSLAGLKWFSWNVCADRHTLVTGFHSGQYCSILKPIFREQQTLCILNFFYHVAPLPYWHECWSTFRMTSLFLPTFQQINVCLIGHICIV